MPRTANTTLLKSKLAELVESGPKTKDELGLSDYYIGKLVGANHAKVVDTRKVTNPETGQPDRGHPANVYGVTPNGRKVAKRFIERNRREAESAEAPAAA